MQKIKIDKVSLHAAGGEGGNLFQLFKCPKYMLAQIGDN